MKSVVHFGDEKIKQSFEELKNSKEKLLYKWVNRAIDDLGENAFCGNPTGNARFALFFFQDVCIPSFLLFLSGSSFADISGSPIRVVWGISDG